jgi:solute carrier family 25 carnitine/acylcarnitine transporter 20/29
VRLESLAGVFANNHFVGEREGRHGSEIGRKNSDATTMATTVMKPGDSKPAATALVATADEPRKSPKHYRGFVAGVFSGIAKLSGIHRPSSVERSMANVNVVGHPFDTIKVRLQTTEKSQFRGPVDCLMQTLRKEGFAGLYKGATPPLVGWMFMDSMYVTLPPSYRLRS